MRRPAAALILTASMFTLILAVHALVGSFEDATNAYERGDYKTAYWIIKSLAEQGDASAQYNLGTMYRKGRGVPQDDAEAAGWYRRAAEQGFAEAQYNLAIAYHQGHGVMQDHVLAHMWFDLVASTFPPSEVNYRVLAAENRDIVASEMTPAQIAEEQHLAREWKPKKEKQ